MGGQTVMATASLWAAEMRMATCDTVLHELVVDTVHWQTRDRFLRLGPKAHFDVNAHHEYGQYDEWHDFACLRAALSYHEGLRNRHAGFTFVVHLYCPRGMKLLAGWLSKG